MIPRVRHNARARQATAGSSSHKNRKRKRDADPNTLAEENPNAEIIAFKTQVDKDLHRKDRIRQELVIESESKVSTKKKKRLDKYIEKKLKQEERVEIFQKLTKTQAESTSTNLQSSATLGTGRPSTHQDRLDRLEDKEVRHAVEGQPLAGKRKRQRAPTPTSLHEDDDEEDDFVPLDGSNPVVMIDSGFSTARAEPSSKPKVTTIGSALKRNADGTTVAPKVLKRKGKGQKTAFQSWKMKSSQQTQDDSDTSFDSSDSANDSAEEDGESDSDNNSDSGSGSEGDDEELPPTEPESEPKPKKPSFKDWAMKQLSAAKGYVAPVPDPALEQDELPSQPPAKKRKTERKPGELMRGPLGEDIQLPATSFAQHLKNTSSVSGTPRTKFVQANRRAEIAEARLLLPIVAEEQPIMEAIMLNPVVIICGETGSGKTTQVPQFLYEAGFGHPDSDNPGMIGITQPRRVAAMSMATRVADELALPTSQISYQIRYDANVSPQTRIKFMTDGVLLRELAGDFLLRKYSVIIIDEAHERSVNTDILIGVLSRVGRLREEMWKDGKDDVKPLRLIIMSATLRVTDFSENTTLFPSPPPIINVAARQHPVSIHFNRRTRPDYVNEAVRKTSKIHARLPPGGILVFLTGQNEISGFCRKLEGRYGKKALEDRKKRRIGRDAGRGPVEVEEERKTVSANQADVEAEDVELGATDQDLAMDVDENRMDEDEIDAEALDSDSESTAEAESLGIDVNETESPMHIVPLYSLLPSEKQMRVFESPPEGSRMVVVSTNVAETSLTIPGIRYVVDCGRAKERRYDLENGIQAFQISFTSKASAAQRAGRAGRTGPGHCYRLYSSAVFENYFDQFGKPEILRMPIEGVVLQMKSMHIDAVVNFPFPTPPDRHSLWKSEKLLSYLGALKGSPNTTTEQGQQLGTGGEVTELGKAMALFPLSPRFSRMLVSGRQHGCLPYVIAIVSALSVGDPFLHEEALNGQRDEEDDDLALDEELSLITSDKLRAKETRKLRRRALFQSQKTHSALGGSVSDLFRLLSIVGAYEYAGGGHKFCTENFVRPKAMEEIHKLRGQISAIVQANFADVDAMFIPNLKPPSDFQLKVLRQLLTAAFIDQVAVRKDLVDTECSGNQYATAKGVPYKAFGISEDVFVHPGSVLFPQSPPDYLVFHEVVRTSQVWLKGLTKVNPTWLPSLGKSLCTFSKPVQNREGVMMVIPKFGEGWELPPIKADSL